ncbi:MAG: class I SAM-dependent methyltransferase [Actinomycetota bacterium]|nr:class I SAM-dependent methyltransferase [Actinomycetota bacterium]
MSRRVSERVRLALRQPDKIAPALLRRALGRRTWIAQGDYVTFDLHGFVSAPSPPLLLARHHYETGCIRRVLGDRRVGDSLEVGCGFGRLTPLLASYSDHHEAVDINEQALAMARTCYPDLRFSLGSATSLPFQDDGFDLVSTWTVLQHIRPQLIEKAVTEIQRVRRPDGLLLLCEATRFPGGAGDGIWDRHRRFYEEAFSPLRLAEATYIAELDRIPGLATPGEVMLFVP